MKIITSYTAKLKQQQKVVNQGVKWQQADSKLMKATADVCLAALKECADIVLTEWEYLSKFPNAMKKGILPRKRVVDILIHGTKDNPAKYPSFDAHFPYMPSYVRRAVIADALGMVGSYVANHKNWEAEDISTRGTEPTLGMPSRYELTFYEQERDLCDIKNGVIGLKLYDGKTWGWYYFRIAKTDAAYIAKVGKTRKLLSPVVEKVYGGYQVRFSFEENVTLVSDENPLSYSILAVDLGINAPASYCVMEADGTVHAKGVIHLNSDEDRLRHLINRKRMYQQAGKKSCAIYRLINNANRQLSINICRKLCEVAAKYKVDCIVFERLTRKGRVKGRRYRERIHLWRANDVQRRMETQAHRMGIRISHVCAWGTSKYAFDGSGPVIRDKSNYSICTFQNGKRYNCDLSACQNIGARYFLRLMEKEDKTLRMPPVPMRTYATLRDVLKKAA